MYLKKMEIVGFKSFADRTKIEFDQGVTAVVGPNGSGKSNIVESLRWVLGEQSAKSLRGGKMPDVIFAGTEKRRALNYAEVIAHFDNADDYLAGHNDDDEVVITRRLYRNGDSEFLINGRKCRLKDIHDLFTDTGLGRDSLSIISQGRIESVFNSKPEERRAIFEEAAGVLKYKNRRAETETKLTSTQDNLDRLEDIIFELNGQLVPLQAQRDVALRFRELDGAREELALSVLVGQLVAEKNQFDETKVRLTEILANLTALSERQKDYDTALSELRDRRNVVEREQEKRRSESLTLTELKSDLTRKIELFDVQKNSSEKSAAEREARLTDLTEKIARLTADLTENEQKLAVLTDEKAALDEELGHLAEALANLSEAPETVIERLRDEFVQLVSQEAEFSNRIVKNTAEIENLTRRQLEADESTRENAEKFTAVSAELSEAEQQIKVLSFEIAQLLNIFERTSAEEKTQNETERLAQNEMYDRLQELNQQKARLASLENIRDSHSNLFAGVRGVMQNQTQIGGIVGVVADLLSFDSKYTTAIDIALGGGSQNIVTEDENAAKRAIAFLREKRLGRATFLPLTTIKPRELSNYNRVSSMKGFIDTALKLVNFDKRLYNAVSSLLGTTIIVDTAENATSIARAMNYTVRIVTLDGTQINPGGAYAGGAGKRNSTTFTNVEIEELQAQIVQSENQLRTAEKAVQAAQAAKAELNRQLADLKAQGEEKRFDEKTLNLKIEQLSEQKADLTQLVQQADGEQQAKILADLSNDNEKMAAEIAKISQRKNEIDQELEVVKSSSQAQNELKDEKNRALNTAKLRLSETTSELRFAAQEKKRLENDLANLRDEQRHLTSLSNPQTAFDSATREKFAGQLFETEQKLQEISVKLVSLKFEREDLSAQMEDLEQHNHDFIEQNQTLNNQKTRLEIQLEQSEKTLYDKQNQLNSDYEMSFEAAQEKAQVLDDLSSAENELKKIERQIRALGSVNLDAITQFDEVNDRYQFLNSQKEDLTEAKNLLLGTINDMNDEVKIRFKSTFDAIRSSFKLTFSQMFVGGSADLELTSDDLLNAGVEINVQPPGKKLASLNLMSGGEKALTALALIFAILRVRTVPFVVLDEVEAALDEANVKRFGDYMNHFDNSNQFIVVTHRRGTMAAAGAMYGVTMADAGVSKILSVRLEENN